MAERVKAVVENNIDTAANLTSADLTPLEGEITFESDTLRFKVGDGVTSWTSLQYFIPPGTVTAEKFDSGWIANSDWTVFNPTIVHNLNAGMSDLIVHFYLSATGSNIDMYELSGINAGALGFSLNGLSLNEIEIRTATSGISFLNANGTTTTIDTESWFYKVVVTKFTIQT